MLWKQLFVGRIGVLEDLMLSLPQERKNKSIRNIKDYEEDVLCVGLVSFQ